MKNFIRCFIILLFAFIIGFSTDLYAKGGSSGRAGSFTRSISSPKISSVPKISSSSSVPKISSSSSVPKISSSSSVPKIGSSNSSRDTVKSGNIVTSGSTTPKITTSTQNRSGSFGSSVSKTDYKAEQNKFTKQYSTNTSAETKTNNVYVRRPITYNTYYSNPPAYVYQTYPYFGSHDTLYLMLLLNTNPSWFYHHSDDPGIAKFKQETRELAKSNAELQTKLDEMDSKIKELEDKKEVKNVNYEDPNFEKVEVKDVDEDSNGILWVIGIIGVCIIGFILFKIF